MRSQFAAEKAKNENVEKRGAEAAISLFLAYFHAKPKISSNNDDFSLLRCRRNPKFTAESSVTNNF